MPCSCESVSQCNFEYQSESVCTVECSCESGPWHMAPTEMAPRYPATLIQPPDYDEYHHADDDNCCDDNDVEYGMWSSYCGVQVYIYVCKIYSITNWGRRKKLTKRNVIQFLASLCYVLSSLYVKLNFPRSYFWGANKIERVSHLTSTAFCWFADPDSHICCSRWFPDFIFV